jgi:hypothetical protein
VLLVAAALNLWGLDREGYANTYYSGICHLVPSRNDGPHILAVTLARAHGWWEI